MSPIGALPGQGGFMGQMITMKETKEIRERAKSLAHLLGDLVNQSELADPLHANW
jgi:hypothetical protein